MKPNPTHKRGIITYDCPYLDDCRYHVALSNWEFWACCECSFQKRYAQYPYFYSFSYRLYPQTKDNSIGE